jgi:hypothetical protein
MAPHPLADAADQREGAVVPDAARRDRVLSRLFATLALIMLASHVVSIANMPLYYERVVNGTVPTVLLGDVPQISNDLVGQRAVARSLTLEHYAAYTIALNLLITIGFVGAALLIALRAGRIWFRWFAVFVLVFVPSGSLWQFVQVGQIGFFWLFLPSVLWPSYLLFWYLFPNGRAVPRPSRWLLGPIVALHFGLQTMALAATFFDLPVDIAGFEGLFAVVLAAFPLILACQVYRFVRVSTPAEREQTKWFVFGFALYLVVDQVLGTVLRADDGGYGSDIAELSMLLLPITLVISILRYRLWDIDIIIRRTLIYGTLTAILALLYVGSVIVLQGLLRPLIGADTQLVTVASTLAIVAVFGPLRGRIQQFIDRRFYRRRYDSRRTLHTFSQRVRDETELSSLSTHLIDAVHGTVQPAHIGLWLRDPASSPSQERDHV